MTASLLLALLLTSAGPADPSDVPVPKQRLRSQMVSPSPAPDPVDLGDAARAGAAAGAAAVGCTAAGICLGVALGALSGPLAIGVGVVSVLLAPVFGGWFGTIFLGDDDDSEARWRIGLGSGVGFLVGAGAMVGSWFGLQLLFTQQSTRTLGRTDADVWLLVAAAVGAAVLPPAGASVGAVIAHSTLEGDATAAP